MNMSLLKIVESTAFDAERISAHAAQIHASVLAKSKSLDAPNFTRIHPADLGLLFAEYDERFFEGRIKEALGTTPLQFGLSKRMTSAGGKTACITNRSNGKRRYEISVSTAILFGCFNGDDHRPITASGIVCRDRLEALQRIMEHELAHLIEMLLWDSSSCSQPRFHSLTHRFFGHTGNTHQLITPRERAVVQFGVKTGMRVRFTLDGVAYTGIINGINKRATVLVEDEKGLPYSNGKRYAKFYVPVQALELVE